MKPNGLNAFDALSKKATTATKKASIKIEASVTSDIRKKVDALIQTKAQIKQLESDKAIFEVAIIGHVQPQIDELAYNGSFTNAMSVPGSEQSVSMIASDRFVVPQEDEPLDALRKVCGKSYDEFFEVRRVITVKDTVVKESSGEKLGKLVDACKKAGIDIAEVFDVADKVVAKDNLLQNQYKLPKTTLQEFRSLVRPWKPSLKTDVSR
jgi:hypothetical protein